MKPTQFNLGQEVLRATEAWLASNTVGVPESIKRQMCCQCPNEPAYLYELCYKCYREKGSYISRDHAPDEE